MYGPPGTVVDLLADSELELVRPGRSSRGARLVVAAWLLGLAGVAGIAVVGRLPGPVAGPIPAPVPAPVSAPDEPFTHANRPITDASPPITDANPPTAAEVRPPLGEDGLMGGLVLADS